MEDRFVPSIEVTEVNELPSLQFEGEKLIVDSEEALQQIMPELYAESIWGFDTETKPSFKKGVSHHVSLMQISNEKKCFLIRLHQTGFSKALKAWIEDPEIQKIGLSLKDDIRELNKLLHLRPKGFIDLQNIVGEFGINELSLKKVAAIVVGGKISKKQRLTNWETKILNEAQQTYAATDAWACLHIYNELMKPNNGNGKN